MAKRSSRSSGQGGSTIYGLLAGLLLGLIVAAVVAFYVTKAPVPFVDRTTRPPTPATPAAALQQAASQGISIPDPNQALRSGNSVPTDTRIQVPDTPTPVTPPVSLPGALPGNTVTTTGSGTTGGAPAATGGDDLGALIASLPGQLPQAPAKPANGAAASAYFLQIGSYQVLEDAESLRARMLLMGLPVQIQRAEVNGLQVNRVRIGPFTRLDEMNRTRARLTEEKINATVVRQ